MNGGCGVSSAASLTNADRLGLLQKMSQDCLRYQNMTGLLPTWRKRVTAQRHSYYLLTMSGHCMKDGEYSLLPTPTATDWKRQKVTLSDTNRHSPGIPVYAAMLAAGIETLPTPATSQDYKPIRPLTPSEMGGGARSHVEWTPGGIISLPDWQDNPPVICRMANGFSRRLDKSRLQALGNSIVPRQVFPFFYAISRIERGDY